MRRAVFVYKSFTFLVFNSILQVHFVTLPFGSLPLPNGSVRGSFGSLSLPNGSVKGSFGSLPLPNGSVKGSFGSLSLPFGSVRGSFGSLPLPNGSVRGSFGSLSLPFDSVRGSFGSLSLPNGSVRGSFGSLLLSFGNVRGSFGSLSLSSSRLLLPNSRLRGLNYSLFRLFNRALRLLQLIFTLNCLELILPRMRIKEQEITLFQDKLLTWYENYGRHFAWRNKSISNYQAVIAEVLLQRTKAETVAKFYVQFIKDYPNWKSLANAEVKAIEEYLRPIGLYTQRSVRLQNLAKEMVKRNGRLPKDRKELETIPFMGQYIANAVELVVFNQPSPLLDVNMARVLERYFGPRKMADIRYDPYLQELAYQIVKHKRAKEINWAILDFAALVCQAQRPLCIKCVLKDKCLYYCRN
jgi:A/G-specific adenine glycosylase